jgi:hypothetical protein
VVHIADLNGIRAQSFTVDELLPAGFELEHKKRTEPP